MVLSACTQVNAVVVYEYGVEVLSFVRALATVVGMIPNTPLVSSVFVQERFSYLGDNM